MHYYNPQKHHRRSIRLQGYDYSQEGCYFITLCVENRQHLFGEIKNGIMGLNDFGLIAYEEWQKTADIRKNCSLGEFIIMPNHMHGIIHIDSKIEKNESIGKFQSPSQTIGAIIRGYKGATTKGIKEIFRAAEGRTGELQFAPNKNTGELQFTPNKNMSELQFAPNKNTGELQFAPTTIDLEKSIWQRNYYEHIIKNNKAYQNISNYILNNPLAWEKDKFYALNH